MDLEAPLDAWYVWLGVAVTSLVLVGVALDLPTEPPPDSDELVNSVDRVGASPYGAQAVADHNAEEVKIGTQQLSLRNERGTSRTVVAYGPMTPLSAIEDPAIHAALDRVLDGAQPANVSDERSIPERNLAEEAQTTTDRVAHEGGTWEPAAGVLRVRRVTLDGKPFLLVDA